MEGIPDFFKRVLQALRKNPEMVLPFGSTLVPVPLVMVGIDPWLACSFVAIIYGIYCKRAGDSERNAKQDSQRNVDAIDNKRGRPIANARKKLLERNRKPKL